MKSNCLGETSWWICFFRFIAVVTSAVEMYVKWFSIFSSFDSLHNSGEKGRADGRISRQAPW